MRVMRRAVEYGDGWMTCCRAQHPEELVEQLDAIEQYADDHRGDFSRLVISYQVTMNIADSEEEARSAITTARVDKMRDHGPFKHSRSAATSRFNRDRARNWTVWRGGKPYLGALRQLT